jgi:hypothetical protein
MTSKSDTCTYIFQISNFVESLYLENLTSSVKRQIVSGIMFYNGTLAAWLILKHKLLDIKMISAMANHL